MISKKRAAEISKELYGDRKGIEYIVSEAEGAKIKIYGNYRWPDLWLVKESDEHGEPLLEPTTIVLIHKETGEVAFHGKAMDEG